jgi:hypothetical protein
MMIHDRGFPVGLKCHAEWLERRAKRIEGHVLGTPSTIFTSLPRAFGRERTGTA